MKKRIIVLFTSVCLIFTAVLGSSSMVLAQSTFEVPQIGDKISGFIVKETTYDQSTKSDKILLEHENTSAKMLIINNSDINRGFSIKFNTPPDSRGTNHILEHSVLGGSEKYPTKNSIFDIINTTYVSFANALTYPNMTMYPICSQSEKQLLKSADVYLDAVFNPLILSDERIFEREGWRYELADEASPLNFNGIVYNEIQGNLGNITSTAVSNANRAVFSDTDQGNNSGGIPSEILTLSYEDLLDTYNEYYHPSNCFMVLYGDVDYVEFLDMIDKDYLSSFTKKTIDIERKTQGQFDKLVEKTYTFPVAEGTDTKNKSVIDLVFAVDDIKEMGMEGYMSLNL
ncbi:MAG: peptidase M16, partial [Clostridiales bacterium]|nr:peptidase M16 [Clostridiales bacterium]